MFQEQKFKKKKVPGTKYQILKTILSTKLGFYYEYHLNYGTTNKILQLSKMDLI